MLDQTARREFTTCEQNGAGNEVARAWQPIVWRMAPRPRTIRTVSNFYEMSTDNCVGLGTNLCDGLRIGLHVGVRT